MHAAMHHARGKQQAWYVKQGGRLQCLPAVPCTLPALPALTMHFSAGLSLGMLRATGSSAAASSTASAMLATGSWLKQRPAGKASRSTAVGSAGAWGAPRSANAVTLTPLEIVSRCLARAAKAARIAGCLRWGPHAVEDRAGGGGGGGGSLPRNPPTRTHLSTSWGHHEPCAASDAA